MKLPTNAKFTAATTTTTKPAPPLKFIPTTTYLGQKPQTLEQGAAIDMFSQEIVAESSSQSSSHQRRRRTSKQGGALAAAGVQKVRRDDVLRVA